MIKEVSSDELVAGDRLVIPSTGDEAIFVRHRKALGLNLILFKYRGGSNNFQAVDQGTILLKVGFEQEDIGLIYIAALEDRGHQVKIPEPFSD